MKNKCYCKILALSVIFLFIGVSFSSAISVDTPSIKVDSENDCGCNEVDDKHLLILETQLNRLEVYSKLLLVLSKHYPELKEIGEELSNNINIFKNTDLKDLVCNLILYIADKCLELADYFHGLFYEYENHLILAFIFAGITSGFIVLNYMIMFYYEGLC